MPVTSQDEVGTRQDGFNLMVRGLDERERMRDLFGVLDYRVIRV